MSHFTVITVHKDGEDPTDILAPFQENNMGDCPEEYLEFERELSMKEAIELKEQTIAKMKQRLAEGGFVKPEDLKDWQKNKPGDQIRDTDLWLKKYIPIYEQMSVKEFITEAEGYAWDEEQQGFGYMTNPNSRWDWYQMGGRWRGYFKPKEGATSGVLGESGVFDNDPKHPSYVDQIRFDEIDFEGMKKDGAKEAEKTWQKYLREKRAKKDAFWYGIPKRMTKKEYIEKQSDWAPFAFINKEGMWCEEYDNEFAKFVQSLEPDDILTLWDCHV